ncbi:VanW family protein [Oscillibacter sp. MSJ-2]|uniref:VanW family protein n=1 Tax=Dysosmobacter acutus TaxID=2841504 RepID=A0ABS6F682_9FIRM|nr:VanW family protein [Dysosmobacter acutus]MBU5625802.1 VanW family protein [Dysosmobacter acutus]
MEGKHMETGKKWNKRGLVIAAVALGVLFLCYIALCFAASRSGTIFPGVRVADTWEVGGMTIAQAEAQLEAHQDAWADDTAIGLTLAASEDDYSGTEVPLTFGEIGGVTMDSAATAQAAYDYCHSANFFASGWHYLSGMLGGGSVDAVLQAGNLTELAPALAKKLSREPVNGAYTMGSEAVYITKAKDGYSLDPDTLVQVLSEALGKCDYESVPIPYTLVRGTVLSAQAVHTAAAREVKNAGYDPKTESIYEAVVGAEFDQEEAQRLLDEAEPGETVEIPAAVEYPAVTADELRPLLFRDVLGTYKTHVSGSSNRISNVKKSAAAINGFVLNTGDVFSYNDVVGERTAARGYLPAPAYVRGETVDEIGGGICQTSSTLYMTALLSDLEIVTRAAHRYVPAYITKGMDATVSWGGPEFRFSNNTDYPIKIVASYSKNYLTVTIYGTNLTGKYVKMTKEELSTTPFTVVYEDDPTLPAGTEQVKTTPYTGYKVRTYRNVYDASGKLISSAFEASSDYKVRNKVILRGTKEMPDTPAVKPETPEITDPVTPETPEGGTTPVAPETPEGGTAAPATPEAGGSATTPETPEGGLNWPVPETGSSAGAGQSDPQQSGI